MFREKEDIAVADYLETLACHYQLQGEYDKAEPYHLRTLAIRTKILGAEHERVAISLNNLAYLYEREQNYQKAKLFLTRGCAIAKKILQPDHFFTDIIQYNLQRISWLSKEHDAKKT